MAHSGAAENSTNSSGSPNRPGKDSAGCKLPENKLQKVGVFFAPEKVTVKTPR